MNVSYVSVAIHNADDEILHRQDHKFADVEEAEIFTASVAQTYQYYFERQPSMKPEDVAKVIEAL